MSAPTSPASAPATSTLNAADVSNTTNAMRNLTLDSPSRSSTPFFTNTQRLRMNEPPRFNGKPEEIRKFITRIKMAIEISTDSFAHDLGKICYMCSFMEGAAFDWAQPYLEDIGSDQLDPCMTSFDAFLDAFCVAFGEVNEKLATERKLIYLRQGQALASEHAATFRRLALRTEFNEPALLALFRESLRDRLKDELAARDMPTDLWRYVSKVVDIDNRIRERETQRRRQPPRPHQRFSTPVSTSDRHTSNNNDDVQPMDLDAAKVKRGSLTQEERSRRKRLGLCMYCGGDGHDVKTCPEKGKGQAQGH